MYEKAEFCKLELALGKLVQVGSAPLKLLILITQRVLSTD